MSKTNELLKKRYVELKKVCDEASAEMREIEVMFKSVGKTIPSQARKRNMSASFLKGTMTVNEAILEAVRNDRRRPAEIFTFLEDHLNITTTKHSISTRLSQMKANGELDRDMNGWYVVKSNKASDDHMPEASNVTGEAATSPNESQSNIFG